MSGLARLTTAPAPGAAPHWSLTPRCAASHWSISRGGVRQWPGDVEHKHPPAHRRRGILYIIILILCHLSYGLCLCPLKSIKPVSSSSLFEFDSMTYYLHQHRHNLNFKQSLGKGSWRKKSKTSWRTKLRTKCWSN